MHPLTARNLIHRAVGLALPVNAPAGPDRVHGAVTRLIGTEPPAHVLDIGCGVGTLLLDALGRSRLTHGSGIDCNVAALDLATRRGHQRGIADRLHLLHADAGTLPFPTDVDVAVCVGSSHAVGGLGNLLRLVRAPRLFLGEGFWITEQPDVWRSVFGPLPSGLSGLVAMCRADGWTVEHAETSDPWEWDAFEREWCQAAARTGLPGARAYAAERWEQFARGYRGRLGFGWLWLTREPGDPT